MPTNEYLERQRAVPEPQQVHVHLHMPSTGSSTLPGDIKLWRNRSTGAVFWSQDLVTRDEVEAWAEAGWHLTAGSA